MRIQRLRKQDADRARANAARKRGFKQHAIRFAPNTQPRLCECKSDLSWNGGEGYCIRCGKTLPDRLRRLGGWDAG